MAFTNARVDSRLRASFVQSELEFLKSTPRFMDALPLVTNAEQYQRLCDLGAELLGTHKKANKAAQQFRRGAQRSC